MAFANTDWLTDVGKTLSTRFSHRMLTWLIFCDQSFALFCYWYWFFLSFFFPILEVISCLLSCGTLIWFYAACSVHIGDLKRSDYDSRPARPESHKPDLGFCQMELKKCNGQMSPFPSLFYMQRKIWNKLRSFIKIWLQPETSEGKQKINRFVVFSGQEL